MNPFILIALVTAVNGQAIAAYPDTDRPELFPTKAACEKVLAREKDAWALRDLRYGSHTELACLEYTGAIKDKFPLSTKDMI